MAMWSLWDAKMAFIMEMYCDGASGQAVMHITLGAKDVLLLVLLLILLLVVPILVLLLGLDT
jgi:hypothetical protein